MKLLRVSPDAEITGVTLSASHHRYPSEDLIIMGFTAESKEYNFRMIKYCLHTWLDQGKWDQINPAVWNLNIIQSCQSPTNTLSILLIFALKRINRLDQMLINME